MLVVEYKVFTASFDEANTKWTSGDKRFAKILNDHIPDEIYDVSSIYRKSKRKFNDKRITGRDSVALDGLSFLGKALKVIHYESVSLRKLDKGEVV
jgi:hypothetical protein